MGQRIRASLGHIAPALGVFESEPIVLLTQAANDLNFTVVVEAARARRLARRFHQLLFGTDGVQLYYSLVSYSPSVLFTR